MKITEDDVDIIKLIVTDKTVYIKARCRTLGGEMEFVAFRIDE